MGYIDLGENYYLVDVKIGTCHYVTILDGQGERNLGTLTRKLSYFDTKDITTDEAWYSDIKTVPSLTPDILKEVLKESFGYNIKQEVYN